MTHPRQDSNRQPPNHESCAPTPLCVFAPKLQHQLFQTNDHKLLEVIFPSASSLHSNFFNGSCCLSLHLPFLEYCSRASIKSEYCERCLIYLIARCLNSFFWLGGGKKVETLGKRKKMTNGSMIDVDNL